MKIILFVISMFLIGSFSFVYAENPMHWHCIAEYTTMQNQEYKIEEMIGKEKERAISNNEYYKETYEKCLLDAQAKETQRELASKCGNGTIMHEGQCWAEELIPKPEPTKQELQDIAVKQYLTVQNKIAREKMCEKLDDKIESMKNTISQLKENYKKLKSEAGKDNELAVQYIYDPLVEASISGTEIQLSEYQSYQKELNCDPPKKSFNFFSWIFSWLLS